MMNCDHLPTIKPKVGEYAEFAIDYSQLDLCKSVNEQLKEVEIRYRRKVFKDSLKARGITTMRLSRFTMKRSWSVGEYDRVVAKLAHRGLYMRPANSQRLGTYDVYAI